MRTTGIILLLIALSFACFRGINRYLIFVEYENEISSNWDLSERASTIKQKAEYVDKFVVALSEAKLDGVNANLIKQTATSDFSENFKALKSLQGRLREISEMDENGFAYQTAIQQITQQEQAEAKDMLCVFENCWQKEHYYSYWNPIIGSLLLITEVIVFFIGLFFIVEY